MKSSSGVSGANKQSQKPKKKKTKATHAEKYGKRVKKKYGQFKQPNTQVEEQPHESTSGDEQSISPTKLMQANQS